MTEFFLKVICRKNKKEQINEDIVKKHEKILNFKHLLIEKVYDVYAMVQNHQDCWYCIFDNPKQSYPIYYHSAFFEIEDHSLSRYWVVDVRQTADGGATLLGIPNWCFENGFYSKLVDGETKAVSTFNQYKELMDMEFPDPLISDRAEIIDDEWLMCPRCIDAWKSTNNLDGMLKCSMKGHHLHNPRYKRLCEID